MKEVHHECLCTGQKFTSDEWSDWCHSHSSSEIVHTFKEYGFNINDCCMNGRCVVNWKNKQVSIKIFIAQSDCGLFSFGFEIQTLTEGSSCLPSFVIAENDDRNRILRGYRIENAAINAGLCIAEKQILRNLKERQQSRGYDDEEVDRSAVLSGLKTALDKVREFKQQYDKRQMSLFDFI